MRKLIIALSTILFLAACNADEFLDVVPTGTKIPNLVEDFDKLLNDHQTANPAWTNIYFMDPDIFLTDELFDAISNEYQRNQYLWSREQYLENEDDRGWGYRYQRIYIYNLIIQQVDDAELGNRTEEDRKVIKGQAYAQRAFAYFYLVNEYAPHYSDQTLDAPAVPMPLKPNLVAHLPRATVGEIYAQMESDLNVADDLLIDFTPLDEVNFRPGKASIHGLKAWVALYKGDFEEAKVQADKALDLFSVMYDYKTFVHKTAGNPWSGLTLSELSYGTSTKDNVWGKYFNYYFNRPALLYTPAADQLFDHTNDFRFTLFSSNLTYGGVDVSPNYAYARISAERQVGVTTPDLLLISAEAHARTGNASMAVARLNTLREKRIANYTALTTADFTGGNDLLNFIKDERRREFFATGKTWFDYKRYDAYGESVPTFSRTVKGTTVTLEPGSEKYVIPISPKILIQNPNL